MGLQLTGVSEEKVWEMHGVMAGNAVRRLKANDPELKRVNWFAAGVGNEEVERLAEGLSRSVRAGASRTILDLPRTSHGSISSQN